MKDFLKDVATLVAYGVGIACGYKVFKDLYWSAFCGLMGDDV